jgi:pimeloyl-ACP methyl ester carboxylesterase
MLQRQIRNELYAPMGTSEAMGFAVVCADMIPRVPETIRTAAASISPRWQKYSTLEDDVLFQSNACDQAGIRIQEKPRQDFSTLVPALVLAGEYDPITSTILVKPAVKAFRRGYYFEFPGQGHSVIGTSECARAAMGDFLDTPTRQPETACLSALKPVTFYVGR